MDSLSFEARQLLPVQIAERLKALEADADIRVRLWTGYEITEGVLRWVFATTVSALFEQENKLPDTVLRQISTSIRRPTLGSWYQMNMALADALIGSEPSPSFGSHFAHFFLKYSKRDGAGAWDTIIEQRNLVIHGGGLTTVQAESLWSDLVDLLDPILLDLCEIHRHYRVVARLSGRLFNMCGDEVSSLETEPSVDIKGDEDGTWLIDEMTEVSSSLRPLLNYEPINEVWEIDQFRTKEDALRQPVPQSYFKLADEKLYYIPIGVDDFVSIGEDTTQFQQIFPKPLPSSTQTIQDMFLREMNEKHVSGFIGRDQAQKDINNWLSQNVPGGDNLGLIVGGPGLGKSALTAITAIDFKQQVRNLRAGNRWVVLHVFNAENPTNDRRFFLHNLRQQLQIWSGKKVSKSTEIKDIGPAEQSVRQMLEDKLKNDTKANLTIFIDGLDEIRIIDKDFPKFIVELLRPGVTVIASTRNEDFVTDIDTSLKVERIPFTGSRGDELPGMQDTDVRAMLLQSLGSRGREIIALDRDLPDGSTVRNPYIEKVLAHADGKPLYVELLVSDLLESGARIEPNVRLPASMADFYAKLLTRQGVSDTKAHLALILCILSLAEGPMSERVLADLLALSPNRSNGADLSINWVRKAISQGDVFFSRLELPDGSTAISIYHQELKRYLGTASQLRWASGLASWLLATASARVNSEGLSIASQQHFRRYGALYLLDHAESVRPSPLSMRVERFVHEAYLTGVSLAMFAGAWPDDLESFLRTFARVDAGLRIKSSDDPSIRLKEFLNFSLNEDKLGLNAGLVHAAIGYSSDTAWLYNELLRTAMSDAILDQSDRNRNAELDMIDWIAGAVGQDRRHGKLDRAITRFETGIKRLESVDAEEELPLANRLRSKLEYERAYCAYFQGNEAQTWAWFEASANSAKLANDNIGLHIGLSVQQNTSIRFARAEGKLTPKQLDAYESFLKAEIESLQDLAINSKRENDRLSSERWVMNCRAHLCTVAYLREDAQELRYWFDVLSDDRWIKKQTETVRESIVGRIKPRVFALEGDLDSAEALYRESLPELFDQSSKGAKTESVAERYMELADLLIEKAELEKARRVIASGLATHDTFGNAKWKPALRERLAHIEET